LTADDPGAAREPGTRAMIAWWWLIIAFYAGAMAGIFTMAIFSVKQE